ncbi:TolC family protein [candidate division KSB1 bacterium]|nr:TolC family protein [candidate division KSB1 bacterium]
MKKYLLLIALFLTFQLQQGKTQALDAYIQQGLKTNLALQQKAFSVKSALAALQEARGMFLPSLSLDARYTRAGGGRVIDIPIGDLVNPIHSSLNQLLGGPYFPENLPNQSTPFLREEEHETKLRLIQPVFQPGIYFNAKIKSDLREIETQGKLIYTRELVHEIKSAYYNYLITLNVNQLYGTTIDLLQENVRVSQALWKQQKVTQAAVLRAKAELADLEQKAMEAQTNRTLSAAYFNFLLNRPLQEHIDLDSMAVHTQPSIPELAEAEAAALHGREELLQAQNALSIRGHQVRNQQTSFLPNITLVADYGYQGEMYRFSGKDDYWMASLVAQWNLFNGGQDRKKVEQARMEKRRAELMIEELRQKIRLQVHKAHHNLLVAEKAIAAADERVRSALQAYEMTEARYRQGMAAQIELIDARNARTQAEINQIITTFSYFIRLSELEKTTAAYPLDEGE